MTISRSAATKQLDPGWIILTVVMAARHRGRDLLQSRNVSSSKGDGGARAGRPGAATYRMHDRGETIIFLFRGANRSGTHMFDHFAQDPYLVIVSPIALSPTPDASGSPVI